MDSRNCLFASVRTTNKWVLVIALVGACMHAISAFATTFPPGITTTACVFFKALNLLIVLLYLSLIVADRKGIPRLYLPYLIIEAIGLICAALMLVVFAAIMVAAPQSWIDAYNKQYPESHMTVTKFRCILALADLSLVLGIALTGVCYTVIYCAYKHVKEGKQCDEKNQKLLT